MIINFSIQNFGPIKERQTLSFEAENSDKLSDYYIVEAGGIRLLKLALIYGANASGKTTVLKALDFLRDLVLKPIQNKTMKLDFEPYLFDTKTPKQNSTLTIEFINEIKYRYEVEFNKSYIVREELYHYANRKTKIYSRETDVEKQFAKIDLGSTIKIDKEYKKALEANTLWNNTVLGGYMKTNIEFAELKTVINWFKYSLRPIVEPRSKLIPYVSDRISDGGIDKKSVIDFLKRADFYISDISIENIEEEIPEHIFNLLKQQNKISTSDEDNKISRTFNTSIIEFEHTVGDRRFLLPLDEESEGTKRYYELAGLLTQVLKTNGILVIDELESSLHPDLFEHFILMFLKNSTQSQIIASTHFREFLSDRNIYRDDAIWFTDKSSNCSTELYSLADFDTTVIRDTSSVINAYKSGKLGAIPNTGDTYIDLE